MPEMETLSQHLYRDKTLMPGDRFDCEGQHVQLMISLGRAKLVQHLETMPDPEPDPDHDVGLEDMEVTTSSSDYRTRDMARQHYNRKGKNKGQQ